MQTEERCILALGSNTDASQHLSEARTLLHNHFPDIRFSSPLHTRPIGLNNPALFINQTAVFHTDLSQAEVKCRLKAIEAACAQPPKDKTRELIYIDIDLLQYGTQVLKADDLTRDYITKGLKELGLGL